LDFTGFGELKTTSTQTDQQFFLTLLAGIAALANNVALAGGATFDIEVGVRRRSQRSGTGKPHGRAASPRHVNCLGGFHDCGESEFRRYRWQRCARRFGGIYVDSNGSGVGHAYDRCHQTMAGGQQISKAARHVGCGSPAGTCSWRRRLSAADLTPEFTDRRPRFWANTTVNSGGTLRVSPTEGRPTVAGAVIVGEAGAALGRSRRRRI